MRLHLNEKGMIGSDYPKEFFRVEDWRSGRMIADFTLHGEAAQFAICDAREKGCRYDHKVSRVTLTAA